MPTLQSKPLLSAPTPSLYKPFPAFLEESVIHKKHPIDRPWASLLSSTQLAVITCFLSHSQTPAETLPRTETTVDLSYHMPGLSTGEPSGHEADSTAITPFYR